MRIFQVNILKADAHDGSPVLISVGTVNLIFLFLDIKEKPSIGNETRVSVILSWQRFLQFYVVNLMDRFPTTNGNQCLGKEQITRDGKLQREVT